jgi:chromosomal replication initiation ATPase DnaA
VTQRPRLPSEAAQYRLPLLEPSQLDLFGFATAKSMGAARPALQSAFEPAFRYAGHASVDVFLALCGEQWAAADFADAPCYEDARRVLWNHADWPRPVMALVGPHFSGKTHLAHIWARHVGAQYFDAHVLASMTPEAAAKLAFEGPLVLDNSDSGVASIQLFSIFNAVRDGAGPVLFVGVAPPASWRTESSDLRSRFGGLSSVRIHEPDEKLLVQILQNVCRKRFIRLSDTVGASLITRSDPQFEALDGLQFGIERLATEDGLEPSLRVVERILSYARMHGSGSGEKG